MNDKLIKYVNGIFAPYKDTQEVREFKEELLADLQQRFSDFKEQGYDDEAAYDKTIDAIGDLSETLENIAGKVEEPQADDEESGKQSFIGRITGRSKELQLKKEKRDFSMNNLRDSDLKGIKVDGKFNSSNLESSDFSGADLTGSSFKYANLRDVKFHGADLTKAEFIGSNLENTSFQDCVLDGTEFRYCNLAGVSFDNLTLNGTILNGVALKGTTFKNTVFRNIVIKRTDFKSVVLDGTIMDKLTYAVMKGNKADLSKVTVI